MRKSNGIKILHCFEIGWVREAMLIAQHLWGGKQYVEWWLRVMLLQVRVVAATLANEEKGSWSVASTAPARTIASNVFHATRNTMQST